MSVSTRFGQKVYEHVAAEIDPASSRLQKSAQISTENCSRYIRSFCVTLFIISLFAAPCFVTGPGARAVLALVPILVLMGAVELNAGAGNGFLRRERWRIRPKQVDQVRLLRSILLILIHAFVFWGVILALLRTENPRSITAELLRPVAGVALLYSIAAVVFEVFSLLFLMAGYSLPLMHRTPIAARSVGEFWSRRWNIIVSAWLHTFIFLPLARHRRASLGVLCAFLVSGLFHGWPILAALGAWPAFTTVAFFVIQGVAVLAEGRWRIHTWPVPIARAWTVIILLVSSPLFISPGLRLFGL